MKPHKTKPKTSKVAILGAGICGLALAYYLQKRFGKSLDITIFEAKERVGGWLKTNSVEGAIFECGPRTLRETSCELFQLIQELGLEEEIEVTSTDAKMRYIVHHGKLEPLPYSLASLFGTTLGRRLLMALFKEPFSSKCQGDDESVQSFFSRRIGKRAASIFVDALSAGIYAASPKSLSMRSCFSTFWEKEQQHGSLVKAALFSKKSHPIRSFTFKEGIESLPKRLQKALQVNILLNQRVSLIQEKGGKVLVDDQEFDHLFSTISPGQFSKMLPEAHFMKPLLEIPATSVVTVSVAYKRALDIPPAFGFLCPEHEDSLLLGIVFDSSLFPQQNGPYATRLSLMFGGTRCPELVAYSDEVVFTLCQERLQKYLGISQIPDYQNIMRAPNAICRYPVGHWRTVEQLQKSNGPITLLGSGLYGVSVGDSVTSAYKTANSFASK